jgi:hypothetical protein
LSLRSSKASHIGGRGDDAEQAGAHAPPSDLTRHSHPPIFHDVAGNSTIDVVRMVTLEELEDAGLPLKTHLDAFFDGTKHMCDFANEIMVPQLTTLLRKSDKECAIVANYFRMILILRSIVVLNHPQHFQTVASATRSLFELYLDIMALSRDHTGKAVQRYHEFTEIERFRRAEQLLHFASVNPNALADTSNQRTFYENAERRKRVETLVRKDKKGRWIYPEHWTERSVRDRAKALDLEALYVETYPLLSWYVHGGGAGIGGMSREALESCFGICHSLVQRFFLDATALCAKETQISAAIEDFGHWMNGLRLKTGEIIAKEQAKQLEKSKAEFQSRNT